MLLAVEESEDAAASYRKLITISVSIMCIRYNSQPLMSERHLQDYDGSGRIPKGASNGGGAYRPAAGRRSMGGISCDDSSGDDRHDRKRSRPKANSLAVITRHRAVLTVPFSSIASP